jgi:hypothetical protein
MKRNILNSPRLLELKKGRQRVFLKKILLSMFALLVIFASLAYLSRLPIFNIREVEIIGNKAVDTEMIKATVEKEIAGNYLWFFPKTNILFYPKDNIKKELYNKFKRLKDITFSIEDNKVLKVSLSERMGSYIWCNNILPEAQCYFMDETGYIFDEAPYFSGEVYFKFYGLNNSDGGIPSTAYFSKENFQQLVSFKETLESIQLKPIGLSTENNGDIKVFLSGTTNQPGPEIIFKADSDFQKVAENLEAALTTEPLQSNFKNKYSSLLYIDLRVKNKVYYKFR